jgi:hypothetical protein
MGWFEDIALIFGQQGLGSTYGAMYGAQQQVGMGNIHPYTQMPPQYHAQSIVRMINQGNREDVMEFKADHVGQIKKIGKHYLVKIGCKEFISKDLSKIGQEIAEALKEIYKGR